MSVVAREAREHTSHIPLPRPSTGRFTQVNAAAAVVAAGVFFLLHFLLELRSQHLTWLFFARLQGPTAARRIVGSLWPDLLVGLVVFAGVELSVNALNVADALLTSVEVRHTGVVETNPVIGAIGLPAKVLLVALITLLLAQRRPRALLWPALVLLGVLAWHVAGLYLNAHVS